MLDQSTMEQFVNTKVELSVTIENLAQIASKYLQTFDIKHDDVITESMVLKLAQIAESAAILVNSLKEIFKSL